MIPHVDTDLQAHIETIYAAAHKMYGIMYYLIETMRIVAQSFLCISCVCHFVYHYHHHQWNPMTQSMEIEKSGWRWWRRRYGGGEKIVNEWMNKTHKCRTFHSHHRILRVDHRNVYVVMCCAHTRTLYTNTHSCSSVFAFALFWWYSARIKCNMHFCAHHELIQKHVHSKCKLATKAKKQQHY